MGEERRGFIMPELNNGDVAHLAEINAMRQMSDTLGRMGTLMQAQTERLESLGDKVSDMHTDIAVMKVRDERTAELTEEVKVLKAEVSAIKLLHAQQDGGMKLVTMLKDFGPWLMSLLIALWALLERKPG